MVAWEFTARCKIDGQSKDDQRSNGEIEQILVARLYKRSEFRKRGAPAGLVVGGRHAGR